ncbi:hypothetical protein BJ742DRAFT_775453 [Cladochytrium replicatum]|nr:hypothetical protein BJ742DRAFT_775453 [Cladochytrium replicatum]
MLCNLLCAYSIYDPEVEYCQGLTFLVGPLIMQNMTEHEADQRPVIAFHASNDGPAARTPPPPLALPRPSVPATPPPPPVPPLLPLALRVAVVAYAFR